MSSPGEPKDVVRLAKEYEEAHERHIELQERYFELQDRYLPIMVESGPLQERDPIMADALQELRKAKEEEREALRRFITAMRRGPEGR